MVQALIDTAAAYATSPLNIKACLCCPQFPSSKRLRRGSDADDHEMHDQHYNDHEGPAPDGCDDDMGNHQGTCDAEEADYGDVGRRGSRHRSRRRSDDGRRVSTVSPGNVSADLLCDLLSAQAKAV